MSIPELQRLYQDHPEEADSKMHSLTDKQVRQLLVVHKMDSSGDREALEDKVHKALCIVQ